MLFLDGLVLPGLFGAISLAAYLSDPKFKNFNVLLIILWGFAAIKEWTISPILTLGCCFMTSIYLYLILHNLKT